MKRIFMSLDEIIEKSDPKDWASNHIGELACFAFALAHEVRVLKARVDEVEQQLKEKTHEQTETQHN